MFGIGSTEFIVLALVVLIFVGPKHLPAALRGFGRIVGELRSASRELRTQIEAEMENVESPSRMAQNLTRDLEREIIREIPDPYEELRTAVEEEKSDIEELALGKSQETSSKNPELDS